MITRLEIITELCELQAEAAELKRMSADHDTRLQRLLQRCLPARKPPSRSLVTKERVTRCARTSTYEP